MSFHFVLWPIRVSISSGLFFIQERQEAAQDHPTSFRVGLSVLTCAYNEESNVGNFLTAALGSKGSFFDLREIVVVASGCTDRTVQIVREFERSDPKVRLIVQPARTGKVSALLEGLQAVRGDIILVESADTLPSTSAFDIIASFFRDPQTNLVGARPVPIADTATLVFRVAQVMWVLHDSVSISSLKVGEAYAFRRESGPRLEECEDDDSFFSVLAHSGRAQSAYARSAIIWTRAPTSMGDLWGYRYRIARLIARRRRLSGYGPSTWEPHLLLCAVIGYLQQNPKRVLDCLAAIGLELAARLSASLAVAIRDTPLNVWHPILSTKLAIPMTVIRAEAANPPAETTKNPHRH